MDQAKTATAPAGKYLTFALGREEYGIPVLKVREIIQLMDITAVPQVPAHIKGVINLRGKVIPIVDLRAKFRLDASGYTDHTCIIVVEVDVDGRRVVLGMIVDGVSEVRNIAAEEIEPTPNFGERLDMPYLQGVAKAKGKVTILLHLDRVLAAEVALVKAA